MSRAAKRFRELSGPVYLTRQNYGRITIAGPAVFSSPVAAALPVLAQAQVLAQAKAASSQALAQARAPVLAQVQALEPRVLALAREPVLAPVQALTSGLGGRRGSRSWRRCRFSHLGSWRRRGSGSWRRRRLCTSGFGAGAGAGLGAGAGSRPSGFAAGAGAGFDAGAGGLHLRSRRWTGLRVCYRGRRRQCCARGRRLRPGRLNFRPGTTSRSGCRWTCCRARRRRPNSRRSGGARPSLLLPQVRPLQAWCSSSFHLLKRRLGFRSVHLVWRDQLIGQFRRRRHSRLCHWFRRLGGGRGLFQSSAPIKLLASVPAIRWFWLILSATERVVSYQGLCLRSYTSQLTDCNF